jgi:SAM-dependent methyltransferase
MVFQRYASYYDGLYRDKDYAAECNFVETLFQRHAAGPVRHVLELGCGTGGHALPLSQRGYRVTAVDRSEEMLSLARDKLRDAPNPVELVCADLRAVDLGRRFEAVIAMFAVISYQTTLTDLGKAFASARRHLPLKGLFLFDAWFGPGVLLDPPHERTKTVAEDAGPGEEIVRQARPTVDLMAQTVRVDYRVARRRGGEVLDELEESHLLRFLFPGEVELLARAAGFEVLRACPFLEPDRPLSARDWNASWALRAL